MHQTHFVGYERGREFHDCTQTSIAGFVPMELIFERNTMDRVLPHRLDPIDSLPIWAKHKPSRPLLHIQVDYLVGPGY